RTPPDSLRGKPILRYLARDSRKLFLSGIRRLRPSSSAEAWDVFLQPHQGPLISASLTVVASQDLTGKFFTLHCHVTNVPARFLHAPRSVGNLERPQGEATGPLRTALCTHDLNGTLLFVSGSLAYALGYQPRQMLGQSLATFLVPSEQRQFGAYLQLIQRQPASEGVLRLSTTHGDEHIFPYRNARYEIAGYPLYVHLYAKDAAIYHRRQGLRQFPRENQTVRTRDRTAELTTINAALQKEIADRKRVEQELQQAHEELERRVAARTVELSQANVLLEREILERRQTQEALRDSEARYRLLSASAPIGIAQADANGELVYVNARWQALAGLPADDALGNRWLEAVHPEDRESVAAAWVTAIRAGHEFSYE